MQLPENLLNSLDGVKGFQRERFVEVHNRSEKVTAIRINSKKTDSLGIRMHKGFEGMNPIPWSTLGYYLPERPSFTLDPFLHGGAYYVQDASSMFLEQAMRQSLDLNQPLKVLDLCAAPGGKSTLIQSLISDESLLVSNEVIKNRAGILMENMTKWGAANTIITNNDPRDFSRLAGFFDLIVVDAPCSGSGLFRKDPSAIDEWSAESVQLCSRRQQRILEDVLPSLKPGGILIYATCSYAVEEDENIADYLLAENDLLPVQLEMNPEWNIVETQSPEHEGYGYRFFPNLLEGEGFYLSVFKKAEDEAVSRKFLKNKFQLLTQNETDIASSFIDTKFSLKLFHFEKQIIAIHENIWDALAQVAVNLYIKQAGIAAGEIIRNEFIPGPALALSTITHDKVNVLELDLEAARDYLRKLPIENNSQDKGWARVVYDKVGLGWVKLLPGRVNNYYPKAWRILHK